MKTGEKTDPVIKSLLQILVKPEMAEVHSNLSQSSGSKETIAAPPTKPVKRLRKKQSMLQKEEVEESQQPKPSKALKFVFVSPGSISSPARSVMSISSGEVVGHQSMSEAEGPEPAKAVKKPASKHGCKRLAAKKRKGGRKAKLAKAEPEKKPAKAGKKTEPAKVDKEEEPGKAKKTKRAWVPLPKLWPGA